ncbi:MAG: hypothetical protein NC080_07270 [Paraprevotella sp.]|nr:hypothetical protein [Paraprevotella sp.]
MRKGEQEAFDAVRFGIENSDGDTAWDVGVRSAALEIWDRIIESGEYPDNENLLYKSMLNGAQDWHQYSYGGCALVYDIDIARRYMRYSDLVNIIGGRFELEGKNWLDVQADALYQAADLIAACYEKVYWNPNAAEEEGEEE